MVTGSCVFQTRVDFLRAAFFLFSPIKEAGIGVGADPCVHPIMIGVGADPCVRPIINPINKECPSNNRNRNAINKGRYAGLPLR